MIELNKWLACWLLLYIPYIAGCVFSIHRAPQLLMIGLTTACISIIPLFLTSIMYSQIEDSQTFSPRAIASVLVVVGVTLQIALRLVLVHTCVHVHACLRASREVIYHSCYGLVPQYLSIGMGMAFISVVTGAGTLLHAAFSELTLLTPRDKHPALYADPTYPGLSFLVHASLQTSLLSLCHMTWTVMTGCAVAVVYDYGYRRFSQCVALRVRHWVNSVRYGGVRQWWLCSGDAHDSGSASACGIDRFTATAAMTKRAKQSGLPADDVVLMDDTGDEGVYAAHLIHDSVTKCNPVTNCDSCESDITLANRMVDAEVLPHVADDTSTHETGTAHENSPSLASLDAIRDSRCSMMDANCTYSQYTPPSPSHPVSDVCDNSAVDYSLSMLNLGNDTVEERTNIHTPSHDRNVLVALSREAREEQARDMPDDGLDDDDGNRHSEYCTRTSECRSAQHASSSGCGREATADPDCIAHTPSVSRTSHGRHADGTLGYGGSSDDTTQCSRTDVSAPAATPSFGGAHVADVSHKDRTSRRLYHAVVLLIASMSMQFIFSGVSLLHMTNTVVKRKAGMSVNSLHQHTNTSIECVISLPIQFIVTIGSILCTQWIMQYTRMHKE